MGTPTRPFAFRNVWAPRESLRRQIGEVGRRPARTRRAEKSIRAFGERNGPLFYTTRAERSVEGGLHLVRSLNFGPLSL